MLAHINGTEIYYEKVGQGIPIMLMHGGLGLDHTYFQPWLKALANKATLIFFDHRGNGLSSRPDSFDDITHQTWIEDADALREYLGYDQIVLLGHSYGGFLAQDYALRFGQHLLSLVLCSTAPVVDYMDVILDNAKARATPEQYAAVKEIFSRPMADDAELRRYWRLLLPLYFYGSNAMYDPALGTMIDAYTVYSAAASNQSNLVTLGEFNALPRLGEIKVPTLVISGRDDWITPLAQGGKRIHDAISRSQLVVFEQSGHWPFIEQKAYFRQVLTDWLDQLIWIPQESGKETPQSHSVTV
ncbi:MAG: alpha/beta fold hydrolase [Pleurocapsa sp. MO_226.B13]|nr:alpha/beta fold hydrolase [Pleurocapsa sp. MO_226.B13]